MTQPSRRRKRQVADRAQPQSPHDPAWWDWQASPPGWPSRSGGGVAWELTLALLAVAIIVAGIAALFVVEMWLADRVLPGVHVADVDLGGLSRDQALARLESSFLYPADRYPALRYGDQVWPVRPEDLGARLEPAASADAAFAIGHQGDLLSRLEEQLNVLLKGQSVMPVFASDPASSTLFLDAIAREINRPLRNAALAIRDDLSVEVIPGQSGREVDQDATRQALLARIGEMTGGEVALVVREGQPLLADVSAAQAQAQRILSSPLVLTGPDSMTWTVEPKQLANWLALQPTIGAEGGATLTVSLNSADLVRFAGEVAAQVARPARDAQFRWDDAIGGLSPTVESQIGQTLDVTATVSLIQNAAQGEQRTVALPLLQIRPALATEDAPKLGIFELIGEGVTSFKGSAAARVTNITVGAAQFDGLLIAPGDTFSFNHYLGEVTADKGYEEGIIIWGNTTKADVGGGLCQVSSTAFRAAFWAGLPITERTPHAFRVSYYEPPKGMDATIYSPYVDLKWVNDTGHYILIHTFVDTASSTLTFRFYGTNPGRTVEMEGPVEDNLVPHGPDVYRDDPTLPKGQKKQIEWAKDGLDVTVYRIIKANGVEVQRETFFSRYRPWQAVFLVGTKE